MKIVVCDVCLRDKKLVAAKKYVRFKGRKDEYRTLSIRFDLCTAHQNFFDNCKTLDEAYELAKAENLAK